MGHESVKENDIFVLFNSDLISDKWSLDFADAIIYI